VLERLQRSIFSKKAGVVIGLGVTMEKPLEILDSNDETNE
jgi:hypothetical protein